MSPKRRELSEEEEETLIELERLKWDSLLYHFADLPEKERQNRALNAFLVWQHDRKLKKKAWRENGQSNELN